MRYEGKYVIVTDEDSIQVNKQSVYVYHTLASLGLPDKIMDHHRACRYLGCDDSGEPLIDETYRVKVKEAWIPIDVWEHVKVYEQSGGFGGLDFDEYMAKIYTIP